VNQRIGYFSLLVPDYDESINYFTHTLEFKLLENSDLGDGKRWVVVQPDGEIGTGIVLAKAQTEEEKQLIGRQGAGRVWLFLHTDDFQRDYAHFRDHGHTVSRRDATRYQARWGYIPQESMSMASEKGNLFDNLPEEASEEVFETLFEKQTGLIERIVSFGETTPENEWYDQDRDEWVLLARGQATLLYRDGSQDSLKAGDYVYIPRHKQHRVTFATEDAIWLAIHLE